MPTRISTSQVFQNAQGNTAQARERQVESAEKAATGKEIVRPSQNPSGWIAAQDLKDQVSVRENHTKNAQIAMHLMTATDRVMNEFQENTQRMHELALSAAGKGHLSDTSRKEIYEQARSIFEATINGLNMKYGNRSVLSGNLISTSSFDQNGNYQGDQGRFQIDVGAGLRVALNVTGDRLAHGVGLAEGVNILDAMKRVVDGLALGDVDILHSALPDLYKGNDQISLVRSEVAGSMEKIQQTINANTNHKIEALESIAQFEEVDAIKVFSDLARDETVLRASISTTKRLLDNSPTDILFKG